MKHFKTPALSALTLVALALAPVVPAVADGHHDRHGFHHFGLGNAVANVVVGLATLPFAIVAAATSYEPRPYERDYAEPYAEPRNYGPGPGYYERAPSYYAPPSVYYRPVPRYYYGPSRYTAPYGQQFEPHRGRYYYRR